MDYPSLDLPKRPVQRAGGLIAAKLAGSFLEPSGLLLRGVVLVSGFQSALGWGMVVDPRTWKREHKIALLCAVGLGMVAGILIGYL